MVVSFRLVCQLGIRSELGAKDLISLGLDDGRMENAAQEPGFLAANLVTGLDDRTEHVTHIHIGAQNFIC